LYFEYKGLYLALAGKTATRMDEITRVEPHFGPLFGPNVLLKVRSEKRNKKEKDRILKKLKDKEKKIQKGH
jgi:hypothetical protein